jgi:5-methylcytosine-specific restriction endonuclease McrA
MAKPRKSPIKQRSTAFNRQAGLCFYCSQPMWSEDPHEFALKYKITLGQAKRFQCTGEHLKAHQDGGTADQANIVAACRFCNQNRHSRKVAPAPDQYKQFIHQRMIQGRWHDVRLIN